MKETKVYVDDELLIYDDFSLCCTKNFDNTFYTNNYSLIDNEEYFEAYFQSIKSHDRALVRQVCEKIKEKAYDFSGYHICECGKKFDTACVDYDDLSEIIEKIQKEFEK